MSSWLLSDVAKGTLCALWLSGCCTDLLLLGQHLMHGIGIAKHATTLGCLNMSHVGWSWNLFASAHNFVDTNMIAMRIIGHDMTLDVVIVVHAREVIATNLVAYLDATLWIAIALTPGFV